MTPVSRRASHRIVVVVGTAFSQVCDYSNGIEHGLWMFDGGTRMNQ